MGFKDFKLEDGGFSEYGNWNVASDYARFKIMRPLYMADEYETIAIFGTSSLIEDLQILTPKEELQIRGFTWLIQTLILVINNTLFAVRKEKKELKQFKRDLMKIKNIIPTLYETKFNDVEKTKKLIINKERYDKVLKLVSDIKAGINEPLNKNHLIFTSKEEFDPKAYKEMLKERMVNRG